MIKLHITPVSMSFQGKYNLKGLDEFARLSRNEQEVLLYNEEIRQNFNEIHPELKTEKELTPLEKYVEEMVAFSRKIAKEFKATIKRGKK